ncbi:mitochondrial zinc maintenance protein 1, mitochondrial [Scheffersomyces amazonensis]|uniref:mitochondrial zinc maintenance protein 1, mitochondrial n=1 Tax=Scheffersomyces amazonensis TaxID=1078765 RepID=UPI00315D7FED
MATPLSSASAKSAYRNALRATRIAFRQDIPILQGARLQIKQGFEKHRNLDSLDKIEEEITKLNEVSQFLIKNIVQGEKQSDGKYFLNFHEKTELGDNETIKQGGKSNLGSLAGAKGSKVKKCSDK